MQTLSELSLSPLGVRHHGQDSYKTANKIRDLNIFIYTCSDKFSFMFYYFY